MRGARCSHERSSYLLGQGERRPLHAYRGRSIAPLGGDVLVVSALYAFLELQGGERQGPNADGSVRRGRRAMNILPRGKERWTAELRTSSLYSRGLFENGGRSGA